MLPFTDFRKIGGKILIHNKLTKKVCFPILLLTFFICFKVCSFSYEPFFYIEKIGSFDLTAYCSCEKCCGIWAKNRPMDENGEQIVLGASGE